MALWFSLLLIFGNLARNFLLAQGEDFSVVYGSDTTWMNVGDCGKGLTCDPKCQLLCLKQHNYYRFLHNAPPLKCDPELAKTAQEWTDEQARKGNMHHSAWTDKFTESTSWKGWGWEGMDKMEGAIPGATRSWYSEIKEGEYNFQTGQGNGQAVGHFQAIVWKSEGSLGCGLNIKPNDGTYVTADYSPASHAVTVGERKKITPQMVVPRKNPEPACDIRSSERQECGLEFKVPFVTPEQCILAGCCYDDMFMNEPNVKYYLADGRTWCFKKKGASGSSSSLPTTPVPGQGGLPAPAPATSTAATPVPSSLPALSSVPGPSPAPTSVRGSAAPGSEYKGDSCYVFHTTGTSWTSNRDMCKKNGGDLVSMETQGEWSYIASELRMVSNQHNNEWHVGLQQKRGQWTWTSGKPFDLGHWGSLEPSGDGPYAMMDLKGQLFNVADNANKGFVCEKHLDPSRAGPPVVLTGPSPPKTATSQSPPGQTTQQPQPGGNQKPPGENNPPSGESNPPPGESTPSTGGSQQPNEGFYKNCLDSHNKYRVKHGSPPLKWSSDLQSAAQKWADHLASIDQMTHDMETEQGENLAYFGPARPKCEREKKETCVACEEIVTDWYSEEEDYDYSTGEGRDKGKVVTHFTQIVWKASEKLGIGTAVSSTNKFYTVARYTPKGNMIGDFTKNVLPQQK